MFERYAVFYTPTGALAEFGARWLGWDSAAGSPVAQPDIAMLDMGALTKKPGRYGMHATLKAPFHLAEGATRAALQDALADFAATHAPAPAGLLELRHEHGCIALRPRADTPALRALAARIVTRFDPFRAPLTAGAIARRRRARLSPQQDRQLLEWGYPFVMEDFDFHMTLTGRVPPEAAAATLSRLEPLVTPFVAAPLVVDAITLMGQDSAGLFHQISRAPLKGQFL